MTDAQTYLNKGNLIHIKIILGRCLLVLKNYKEADIALEHSIRVDPKCVDAYFY